MKRLMLLTLFFLAPLAVQAIAQQPVEEWVRRYDSGGEDRANALAVDSAGNVYVTGYSGGRTLGDYATIKYSAAGDELWVRRYSGPGYDFDEATALAVDSAGNVYVTGNSAGSGTYDDYATVKYAPDGDELWVRRYNGPGNREDWATALAVDSAGNVYVTGSSWSGTGDCATIKYSAAGDELWVRRYNGIDNAGASCRALAVDSTGNVYVTGYSRVGYYTDDYVTIKYNTAGEQLWVARYNGPVNYSGDQAWALAVDSAGNVYVTGQSTGIGTGDDYATIKYNTAGEQLWVARYDGPANADRAHALAVDSAGNVYVTGYSLIEDNITNKYSDYATIKYSAAGDELWVRRYNGPDNATDTATALAVDSAGNVYVTGWSAVSSLAMDYATVKYDTNGNELWVARYNGPDNGEDTATALAVDSAGNVYVTGLINPYGTSSGRSDYATIKYSQNQEPTNKPPTANAGENLTMASEDYCQVVKAVQGTASDADNDPLQYRWLEGQTEVLKWSPLGPNGEATLDLCAVSLDLGQHTLTLEVSDSKATAKDDMLLTIANSAPTAGPTGGGTYQVSTSITVGGQVSDFDGDLLTYTWSEGNTTYCSGSMQSTKGGTPVTLPDCKLPSLTLGTHTVLLTVSDGINQVSNGITINVMDTTAPTLAPDPNITILWPPDHKMVNISINANAKDDSGLPVTLSAAVKSDEPQEGLGDGDMAPDWTTPVINQQTITLQLRAERSGSGNGREYTIAVTATDNAGNKSTANVMIVVPHDTGK